MKYLPRILPCFFFASLHGQLNTAVLQTAGTRVLINSDGTWGQSSKPALSLNQGKVQVPLLNKLSVWVSGRSGAGTLMGSFSDVFSDSSNFLPGPLGLSGAVPADPLLHDKVFTVQESEVMSHRRDFRSKAYQLPSNLMEWPANGNQGFDPVLAPFADFDQNGKYNPAQGDYPYFSGNACAYTIANDFTGGNWKHGNTPGIEIQQLVRTFQASGQEDQMFLIRFTVHNRSLNGYKGMRLSLAADFSIGSNGDDYLTTDVVHNALIAYNGSDSDVFLGKSAPACALMFLNRPVGATIYFESGNDAVKGKPRLPQDFYNLARASWKTGKPLAFGNAGLDGNNVTRFVYSNGTDPDFSGTWNEWDAANFPGRRTGVISTDSFDLPAGESIVIEAAVSVLPGIGNKPERCKPVLDFQQKLASYQLSSAGTNNPMPVELFSLRGSWVDIHPPRTGAPVKLEFFRLNGSRIGTYCILNNSSFNLKNLPEEGTVILVATSGNQTSKALLYNTEP